MRRFITFAFFAALVVTLAACTDDDAPNPTPTSEANTAIATLSPTASPSPSDPSRTPSANTQRTGIPKVDAAIDAMLAKDPTTVRTLIVYTPTACVADPEGIGAPPSCRGNEVEGDLVDVLPIAQCEGVFNRSDEISDESLTLDDPRFEAVYRTNPGGYPPGSYMVIFSRKPYGDEPEGERWAASLVMTDAGITGIHYGCGQTVDQFIDFNNLADAVIPTQQQR